MPSQLHEQLLELFENEPELAASLSASLGVKLPDYEHAETASADLTDTKPTEYRADRVVILSTGTRKVAAIVVEVQLRPDPAKQWSWPVYKATLRARLRCPVVLLVLVIDGVTAAWASEPIDLGFGLSSVQPLVLGPSQVPVVTDPETAVRLPELAVLSAIAHQDRSDRTRIFDALLTWHDSAIGSRDSALSERARIYVDFVHGKLNDAAKSSLEALMTTAPHREYTSELFRNLVAQGREEGRERGLEEGLVHGLMAVLGVRRFEITPEIRERIESCGDADTLDQWLRRATTAETITDVFS
ncbi:hypothetical protein GPX89_07295 [Nocardia sp. ET3-3]|uniref:Transposase (putative) YhgA-like domain-containing protein n=1 Tax=Nocardia terrae TaxID=2675851 RepID=A0A7K1URT0_9NOCA|nr:hypothetical protein [Nocardia terrae]MVU77052.1 hypothetical protein [Nocardia terrae]